MRFIQYIFLFIITLSSIMVTAQEKKEWSVTGNSGRGENGVSYITGNVIARKGDVTITCDNGISNPLTVTLEGNVVLTKEGTKLYATQVVIDKMTDLADIKSSSGYVRVVNTTNGIELKAPSMTYHTKNDIFKYYNGGVITSKDYILESETGSYYEKLGLIYVKNGVQVHNKEYFSVADSANMNMNSNITNVMGNIVFWHKDGIMTANRGSFNKQTNTFRLFENSYALSKDNQAWADSIVYDRNKEMMYLGKNICIIDTANHGALVADYGFIDKKREYAFATKNAAAIMYRPKEDTLFLKADTLMVYNLRNKKVETKDSLIRIGKALRNTRYFRNDLQGACDSLVYTSKDSVLNMFGVPLIWNEQNQISADSISIYTKNNKVDRAELILNSFIAQKETEKYFNQIKGRTMTVHFNDKNKISKIDVKGNGQTVYFVKDSTSIEGVNLATSSGIGINLENGKVETMVFRSKPESNLFPLKKVEESQLTLKGFKWSPDNRPLTRFDITKKVVKQSRAKEVEAIKKPTFPYYKRTYGKSLNTDFEKAVK